MATRRAYLLLGLSGLAFACAVHKLAESPNPTATAVTAKNTPPSTKTGREVEPSGSASSIDLARFRPVLAEPSHDGARLLVEARDPAGAARKLWPDKKRPASEHDAEVTFLAASLWRDANLQKDALDAFVMAAEWSGPLRADAYLRAAETAASVKDLEAANSHLKSASELHGEVRYERARAMLFLERGEVAEALQAYRLLCTGPCALEDKYAFGDALLKLKQSNVTAFNSLGDAGFLVGELRLERAKRLDDPAARRRIEELLKGLGSGPAELGERIAELRVLVDSGQAQESLELAKTLLDLSKKSTLAPPERCELDLLYGKVLALSRDWGAATDHLRHAMDACKTFPEKYPALLFNLGKFAAADGRDAFAVQKYAELERLFPENSLADDARLRAAKSYKDLGNLARFTELLTKMPEDYPTGDMTPEGVLELALHSAERNNWGAASLVLERGSALVRAKDSARGTERSGAERYFWARSLFELGEKEKALAEYESLVREVPLSYYMLHAYSRLVSVAPERAESALQTGLMAAENSPFLLSEQGLADNPVFRRGLSLLRVGELEEGRRVLGSLELSDERKDSLLWAMALLLDRSGDAESSHQILRGRLTDWLGHYPNGPWRTPWEVGFPRPYHNIVQRESAATGVPEWLIYGVMREESTFDPSAESPAKAFGLMQLIEPTARMVAKPLGLRPTRETLLEPTTNIRLGSRVLKDLLSMFRVNPSLAIPAYNAGPGRPRRWLRERPSVDFDLWVELIPIRETRRYTKRVLASQAAYAFLYGPEKKGDALRLPERLEVP